MKVTGLEKWKEKCKEKQEFQESALLSRWKNQQPAWGVAAWTPVQDQLPAEGPPTPWGNAKAQWLGSQPHPAPIPLVSFPKMLYTSALQ